MPTLHVPGAMHLALSAKRHVLQKRLSSNISSWNRFTKESRKHLTHDSMALIGLHSWPPVSDEKNGKFSSSMAIDTTPLSIASPCTIAPQIPRGFLETSPCIHASWRQAHAPHCSHGVVLIVCTCMTAPRKATQNAAAHITLAKHGLRHHWPS